MPRDSQLRSLVWLPSPTADHNPAITSATFSSQVTSVMTGVLPADAANVVGQRSKKDENDKGVVQHASFDDRIASLKAHVYRHATQPDEIDPQLEKLRDEMDTWRNSPDRNRAWEERYLDHKDSHQADINEDITAYLVSHPSKPGEPLGTTPFDIDVLAHDYQWHTALEFFLYRQVTNQPVSLAHCLWVTGSSSDHERTTHAIFESAPTDMLTRYAPEIATSLIAIILGLSPPAAPSVTN